MYTTPTIGVIARKFGGTDAVADAAGDTGGPRA
jgi:hypothetical protein